MHDHFSTLPGCGPLTVRREAPLRQQVLEQVRAQAATTRADLARSLGVSPASVTAITADLIALDLLQETTRDASRDTGRDTGRGRPPVALSVQPAGRYTIGIKLAEDRHSAALIDFAGNLAGQITLLATRRRQSAEELAEECVRLVDAVRETAGIAPHAVLGLGVGLAGIVDHDTGVVAWSPLLDLPAAPLADLIADRTGLPTCIDNDANMLTLAELWFGAGRDIGDFAVVTVEQGVGMGFVTGHRLFRGTRGMGLELGHTKVQLDGALCRCGQRGCLEAYVADYALVREAATALDLGPRNEQSAEAMLDDLFVQAKAGDSAALTIFRRAGRYLSVGLANVIQIFDPSLIILSGERMQYDFLYADEVLAEMRALTLPQSGPVAVEVHAWGGMVWARGAAALALDLATARLAAER